MTLVSFAAFPLQARAQLAKEDALDAADATAGSAAGSGGDANPTNPTSDDDSTNPPDATTPDGTVAAPPPPSLDLNILGLEAKFPDSPLVGRGVSVQTGKTFANLEADALALGAVADSTANTGTGNGTDPVDGTEPTNGPPIEVDRSFLYDGASNVGSLDSRLACKRGCVDPTLDVNLVWCLGAVTYTYCNRVVSENPAVSVLDTEEAAIAAYMALARRVPKPNAPECRPMLRKWMCYEFFSRCNDDETAFYPVCATTCAAAKYACGSPGWIECDQEIEELDGTAPDAWYVGGNRANRYIRGVKPDGFSRGIPVFESDALRCTGAGRGMFRPGTALLALAVACASIATHGAVDERRE